MTIVRWDPTRELGSLQQQVNQVFSAFFDPTTTAAGTARWTPAVDLVERDDQYVLIADLPGVDRDEVAVEVEGDTLTLSGTRQLHRQEQHGGFVRAERASGSFRRQLTLPQGVDAERIEAEFDRGVLEVRIPKPEAVKPKRIAIRTADRPETIEAADEQREAEPATV
ncbi:Hsp20/alpha crystallin family protein [Patulibacter defluvii]|uniref:Hsp20/alpha crystallin family protein n=1 Tax=Patulibacter defluvii TaxID=3095358 RepID=UPI002A75C79C|nr:Hsp20/alpha crystallin family protein [Patulibacter sp. DM4]